MEETRLTIPSRPAALASERVDLACDRFEAAFRAGKAPRIEDYLAAALDADRLPLLQELVAVERELRKSIGESPDAQEYLARFPGFDDAIRAAFETAPAAGGERKPRPRGDTARNLLLGILALQNNFISPEDLLAAFALWADSGARPLGQILVDRRALDDSRRALLEALVAEHLKRQGGDGFRNDRID